MSESWAPPSPRAAALLRDAARLFLEQPTDLVERMDEMVLAAAPEALRAEPTLAAEVAASNRANIVHWATCNLQAPGARVPVNLSAEVLDIARDIVRRGLDQSMLDTYRAGQNLAWRYCMRVAFSLSSDPAELEEALDVAARSIFTFVDDTLAGINAQMERERSELTRGTHAERFEVVTLILEGAPIASRRAGARLRYDLERRHVAAIVWSDPGSADHGELVRAAEALARAAGAAPPLTVVASATSLWAWFVPAQDTDGDGARSALEGIPGVRAALGPVAAGIEGFRRSHLNAVDAHRLMVRMHPDLRVVTFDDVQLVALVAHDEERTAEFVASTLGDLAGADPELRHTVRVFIREQSSASRAARALYTHRNTVLNRLQRAERLLPAPLEHRVLEVGLALEIVHWLGARGVSDPA